MGDGSGMEPTGGRPSESRSPERSERGAATGSAPKRRSSWRRVLLIVFCLLLGLAAGVGYYVHTPKSYQASATVLVLPTATGLDASPGGSTDINMETEAELARSTSVADQGFADTRRSTLG